MAHAERAEIALASALDAFASTYPQQALFDEAAFNERQRLCTCIARTRVLLEEEITAGTDQRYQRAWRRVNRDARKLISEFEKLAPSLCEVMRTYAAFLNA